MRIKGILNILPDSSKLLLATSLWLMMMAVASLLGAVSINFIYGLNIIKDATLLNDFTRPHVIDAMKLMQVFSSVITFIITPIFIAFLFEYSVAGFLGLNKIPDLISIVMAIALMFAIAPIINLLIEWNANMHLPESMKAVETWMQTSEQQASKLTDAFLANKTIAELCLNIFIIALIPAIGEELFFRGIVQQYFSCIIKNNHVAIIITAIIFSAIHMQFYGFIPRMILGIVLGYLFVWSKSLWLPVIAHFINNAASVLFSYFVQHQKLSFDPDTVGTQPGDVIWIIASVVLSVGCLFLIHKKSAQKVIIEVQ